jgi:Tfp pilus assembly protein PilO
VAGVLFLLGGLTYFLCAKQLGSVVAKRDEMQRKADENKQVASRLKDAEATFLQAQSEISCLETSVSSKAYVPTMLGQLEGLAKSLNLKVVSVRPQAAPPPPPPPIKRTSEDPQAAPQPGQTPAPAAPAPTIKPYDEQIIEVEIEGSYWNARNFISRLTVFPKIVAVKEINMSPSDAVQRLGSPNLNVKLRLTAYVFPVPEKGKEGQPGSQPAAPKTETAKGEGRSGDEG